MELGAPGRRGAGAPKESLEEDDSMPFINVRVVRENKNPNEENVVSWPGQMPDDNLPPTDTLVWFMNDGNGRYPVVLYDPTQLFDIWFEGFNDVAQLPGLRCMGLQDEYVLFQ
ncbi:hypothetical protein [Streptomyces sp. NBC_01614]|uniref:hypothetical protein n=1 Tax=Streptomyces sp. NBC_01614 TaxID=2975897 RepID=UPI003862DFAA